MPVDERLEVARKRIEDIRIELDSFIKQENELYDQACESPAWHMLCAAKDGLGLISLGKNYPKPWIPPVE